ncbi:MAG: RelA/SpoT family protein [Pseudanabaenaceae cyanobacterium]
MTTVPTDLAPDQLVNKAPAPETSGIIVPQWLKENTNPLIQQAFAFAYQLHSGQLRASGEPYILHPIQVATILRDLGADQAVIAAGFLHDVIEDTEVTAEELEAKFGKEVRNLVEGVTKLSKFNFESKTERQAENFRRMFLAMAQDIRVIIVKLADRLHNMRTLEHLPPHKQQAIARETMEIFAPLANRLGIGQVKWELEDLAFKYLDPTAYRQMQALVADTRANREGQIQEVIRILSTRLENLGFQNYEIKGRPKHLYGIYNKMTRQEKEYSEIYDVLAVRVIVNTNEECYRVLAIAHDSFRPIPGRFKDYIGLPKPNRYQSLHTAVIGPNGQPVEIQIRTWEMHRIAEYGIAAHWKYKEANSQSVPLTTADEKFTWLRQLVEWQRELKDPQEYLDSVKEDLFDQEVYVFSPKGDVYCLPQGATPVDFAYRVHTEVGNHCTGALVNGVMVPLSKKLKNGDIIQIINQNNAHPSLDWINFVATNTARNRIRQWYKKARREENIALGRNLLEKEFGRNGLENLLKSSAMEKVAEKCNYHSVEDLLAAIGYGEMSLNTVVHRLRENVPALREIKPEITEIKESAHRPKPSKSPIIGVEGMLYTIAGCCKPLPGEPIVGVVTLGSNRGISIHRQDCPNLTQIPGGRFLPVRWNTSSEDDRPIPHTVDIKVEAIDRVGVFKDILTKLADSKINVRQAHVKTRAGSSAMIFLSIDIQDRDQFERVCQQIKRIADIISITRVTKQRA